MNYRLYLHAGIAEIDRDVWNRFALMSRTPLYEWEWLALMEESGSITPETGWLPMHALVMKGEQPAAIMPLYVKGHSNGEFVFDYGWADLAGQLNVPYYPKLVGTVPATPSGFYRFLCDSTADPEVLLEFILSELEQFCLEHGIQGMSFLFSDPAFGDTLKEFTPWENQSYLWINRGYPDFDAFLRDLTKNQRRNIRREWGTLKDQGLEIRPLTGDQLTVPVMERMFRYYLRTNEQFGPWAARFLNRDFFLRLPEFASHRTVIFAAVRPGEPPENAVGMSMCIYKGEWLFGRYWGCEYPVKNLHFNTCYYAPMRWMIERGIRYFDPGAGSPHKLQRGFMPHRVTSYHRFFHPAFQGIFRNSIDDINRYNREMIASMEESVPFHAGVKFAIRSEIHRIFNATSGN